MIGNFDRSWYEMISQSINFAEWQLLVDRYSNLRKQVYGEEPSMDKIPSFNGK